ncbi:MAG: hypothetical protein ACJ76N_09415 [Thermoanaerobaculia bacterium]
MKTITRFLLITALVVSAGAHAAHAFWPDNHVNQAEDWIFDPYVNPANNVWGAPASITVDPGGTVHATSKCGSFTALLLKAAYPGVITDSVLSGLTGSSSPDALQWYTAIATEKASTSGIKFHKRTSVASIQPGDILASAYTTSGDTGHAMTVKSITLTAAGTTLTADKSDKGIPGVGNVNKYQVTVYDSTSSPHGGYASNPAPDTRYKQTLPNNTVQWVQDDGIGSGTIVIYEEVSTGRIVAWAWNVSPTTTSYYYAFTFTPTGSYDVRPIVAGYLDGPGL